MKKDTQRDGLHILDTKQIFFKNSFRNDPFYPILIPNTPYVKFSLFFFLVVGGSQKSKNIV